MTRDLDPIKRDCSDNQYYISKDTFKEIPQWKPTFNYAHPPLFFEGHQTEPTEAIERRFYTDNYMDGIALVNKIAQLAEVHNHHPRITINYNNIAIQYYTHRKSGTITNLDLYMAKQVDELLEGEHNA